jgi:predicted DNA-binding ribbon-helix-helix protein
MTSTIAKRSIVIAGHKTSISLEDEFWTGLKAIAESRRTTLSALLGEISQNRRGNLSSAIRVFVFGHLCAKSPAAATNGFGAGTANTAFVPNEPPSL